MRETFDIDYEIEADSRRWEYTVTLDQKTLETVNVPEGTPPAWAELEYEQCSNCPLDAAECVYCPLAVQLDELLKHTTAMISHEPVRATVKTPQRTIVKETTAQRAVGSLMGLLMATSGCPHTRFLRPMARFHLPFADEDETIYRATSTYLLAQHFKHQKGEKADVGLEQLKGMYDNIQVLNSEFSKRMIHAVEQDASMNALVFLDLLAQFLTFSLNDSLNELRPVFDSYLDAPPEQKPAWWLRWTNRDGN